MTWETHDNHDIQKALRKLRKAGGWNLQHPYGHWGRIYCDGDASTRGGAKPCSLSIGSTPRSPGTIVKRIKQKASRCKHGHRVQL